MNTFKTIFTSAKTLVWLIVSVLLIALFTVATILANSVFYDLFTQILGKPTAITVDGTEQVFELDKGIKNKTDARENGWRVNELLTDEGMVLLKNRSSALPLAKGAKISVFGKNSVDIVTGGSGSGGASKENEAYRKSIFDSLEAAGFTYNTALKSFYESSSLSGAGRPANPSLDEGVSVLATGETPQASYTDAVKSSYANYKDAAIIVFSRIGGESFDLPRTMGGAAGANNPDDHYLRLDKNEQELIAAVTAAGFGKVIVALNSATAMELGSVDDNNKIDACLWIGATGDTGIMSLGRILSGEVNPSGHTIDTFAREFKASPTWANFGNNLTQDGQLYTGVGTKKSGYSYAFVDYEEDIYVGYRYYETRGASDASWYADNVVYPFGHGLSYTTFTQKIKNKAANTSITANGKLSIDVEVTNTGDVPGRDAVQVYITPPYTSGGIEKPHLVLAGFEKTDIIAAKASASVTVEIEPYYFASYDYADKNGNGHKGYELDAGSYTVKIGENAHTMFDSFTATVSTTIKYDKDPVTGKNVVNRFGDSDDEIEGKLMSRANFNGTMPASRTTAEKVIRADTNTKINSVATNNPFTTTEMPKFGQSGELTFRDMVDSEYTDDRWDVLLGRISKSDMIKLIGFGGFKTMYIERIGKPATTDADGPSGFANFLSESGSIYGVANYACESLLAASWNKELLYSFGTAVGNEALIGNEKGDGIPYSGWYAPGMNIHRSPFGGRTGEYFSEDPFLSGMLGAMQIRGAMSKGVYTQVKHFAVNEQETSRAGLCTWLSEQALREIYLRPFEMAVKVGGTMGMMSSFNRIGAVWTGGDYRLLTEVLRVEWGFEGMVICDYNTGGHMNAKQMHYAGGDLNLQTDIQNWRPDEENATDMTIVRMCAKNILYTVNNSNIMNTEVIGYRQPLWVIMLIVSDAVLVAGLAVWGFFAIRGALKKKKKAQ